MNKKTKTSKNVNKYIISGPRFYALFIIILVISFMSMTKIGALPNFFNIDFLCPGESDSVDEYPNGHDPMTVYKPVIYLYPERDQLTSVNLEYLGDLTVTYPDYRNGWNVVAHPDGKITNLADGRQYSYLFWEGVDSQATYDMTSGFVVRGSDTVQFLQDSLSQLGLNPVEYNEFVVFWLPKMQFNEYNLIHFATKSEYDDRAVLNINPKPDSMLRIFMAYKPIEKPINVKPQVLQSFERKGFTVVEWGGSPINN